MEKFRPLGAFLCVYEIARLIFLTGAFVHLQPVGTAPFPLLALITPGALFFLMALFWTLDLPRYRVYGPLFLVGKGLGIITAVFWILFTDTYMIGELLQGTEWLLATGIVLFLVPGDTLSAWMVIRLMRR